LAEWHAGLRETSLDLCKPMINLGVASQWSEIVGLYFSVGKNLHRHDGETQLWSVVGIQLLL
jgi:hypothetical protein